MSKKNKLLEKLIGAAGGWEKFLHQTLEELCDAVSANNFIGANRDAVETLEESVEEAKEILEAYEEAGRGDQPNQILSTSQSQKVVEDVSIKETSKPVRATPVIKTMKTESVEGDVKIKLEDFITTLAPRTPVKPRRLTKKMRIDPDAGECQGVLSVPANYKLVNSQTVTITTEGNLELGRGTDKSGFKGQITGQSVSGHVSMSGKYKLVFKDTNLGIGLIHFDVVAIPPKMNKNQFEKALALQNNSTVESVQAALQLFGKIIVSCQCGKDDCYGWRVANKAEIEEAEAQRKGRMTAIRNANTTGEVR